MHAGSDMGQLGYLLARWPRSALMPPTPDTDIVGAVFTPPPPAASLPPAALMALLP